MGSPSRFQGAVCNIGPAERRNRMICGVILIQIAILAWALLLAFGIDRLWRLPLMLPLWLGLMGIAQANYRICVGFDVAGRVDPAVAGEVVGLNSPAFKRALRIRSLKLVLGAGALAGALTVLATAIG